MDWLIIEIRRLDRQISHKIQIGWINLRIASGVFGQKNNGKDKGKRSRKETGCDRNADVEVDDGKQEEKE